jgi:hypothetical protein
MRRRQDRFCRLAFWPTVEFDDAPTPAPKGNCKFWSESDDYVIDATWNDLCDVVPCHSVFDEPDFCSVWDAQRKALTLCVALHTDIFNVEYDKTAKDWVQIWINPIDSMPVAKSQEFCFESYNPNTTQTDALLAEPLSNTTTLISRVHSNVDAFDDDEADFSSFMAAGPNKRPVEPPSAIIDRPGAVQQDTDLAEFGEDATTDTTSDDEEDIVWRDSMIFSAHHPPANGVVNSLHRHVLLRNVARIASIAFQDLLNVHQVHHVPDDMMDLNVYLVQHQADLPQGSDLVHILADVEFHPPAPSWETERVRCPIYVPPTLTRHQLLRALDVFQYSQFVQDTSLVWHNHNLVSQDAGLPVQLCNGDFVRIALPPPLTVLRSISTRCIARMLQMGIHADDLEAFYWISNVDEDLDPMPTWRYMVSASDLDCVSSSSTSSHSLLQANMILRSSPQPKQHHREDDNSDRCHFETCLDRQVPRDDNPFVPLANDFVADLLQRWHIFVRPGPGEVEPCIVVKTWYNDHDRWPICDAAREVSLFADSPIWRADLLRAWPDRLDPLVSTEIVMVDPDPVDETDPVAGHLILIQRPHEGSRSVLVSVMDNTIWNGYPRRWALRSSVDPSGAELVALMGYRLLCPPHMPLNRCQIWCRRQEIGMDDDLIVRHGLAITLTVVRHEFNDDDEALTLLQLGHHYAMTTIGFSCPAQPCPTVDTVCRPSSHQLQVRHHSSDITFDMRNPNGPNRAPFRREANEASVAAGWLLPVGMSLLQHARAIDDEGHVEVEWMTWYLCAPLRTSSTDSRPLRIDIEQHMWLQDLQHLWRDQWVPHMAVSIHVVEPIPPKASYEQHVGHLLIVQGEISQQVPVLVTTLFASALGRRLSHMACFPPHQFSPQQLLQTLRLEHICQNRGCPVEIAGQDVPLQGLGRADEGDNVRVHVQARTSAGTSLLQTGIRRHAALNPDAPAFEPATEHPWERLTTDAVAHAQWPQEVGDGSKPRRLSLDDLTSHEVPSIRVPCDEVSYLARQLFLLNLGPILSFASVVKWHDSTLQARPLCPDWTGAPPVKFWFYTDGASCFVPEHECRHASAAVIMLVETEDGVQFGGFRSFLVPMPATAPFAEHVAMLIAHLWCLQMHEWCFSAFGYWGVPVTFAFDCLAAGHAALGTWTCPQHRSVHRLTQSLTYWMNVRYGCQHLYDHVRSHQGDAWNEAADAACWAALHGWIAAPDFEGLFSQALEPHLCAAEWLGYWHLASLGITGYPSIRNGYFEYSLPAGDQCVPDPDLHVSTMRGLTVSNSPVENVEVLLRCATANVLTLYTTQTATGGFVSARHEALMTMFHHQDVHVVGVQESRSKLQGHHAAEHFHVLSAPALRSGHCGVQLWVAKKIAVQDAHLTICASHLRVLHQSARRLIVRLAIDGLRILLIVGHVPCAPDDAAAKNWWHDTTSLIPSSYCSWPRIMMVDANGKVGSLTSQAVGDYYSAEENFHGALMHQWLIDHNMFAPQTFAEHHSGSSTTFAHSKGPESRIDYVLLDECLRGPTVCSKILDIDLAIHRPDHFAVCVEVPMFVWRCHRDNGQPRKQPFCSAALPIEAPPVVDWSRDVHTHAALLHQWLQRPQPTRPRLPRKRHLQPQTWHLIQQKAGHWKRLRQITTTLRKAMLRCIFGVWRKSRFSDHVDVPSCHAWLRVCHQCIAWHVFHHRRLGLLVSQQVRGDDAHFYQTLADRHSDESLPTLWKSLKPLLPRQAAKRRNNIRCIGPATSDIVAHFDALEAGEAIPYAQLLSDCHRGQQERLLDAPVVVPLRDLPSNIDVVQLCRQTKVGKAPGLDEVTATTLQRCLLPFATSAHLLFLKVFLQASEPLQWKGGKVHVIPKKSNVLRADAMRGIMLLTGLGKMYHAMLRKMMIDWASQMKIPAQLGGFQKQQTSFATHLLRTFCILADAANLSCGVIFFDVRAAFHSMLREHAFGGASLPPRLCEVLDAAGFDIDQLQRDVGCHGASFQQHPNLCLQRAVQDAHSSTWYVVDGHAECHQTHRGSRPGSPLADIAYNITMTNVLRSIEAVLWQNTELCHAAAQLPIFPPLTTWVDDLAIPVPSVSAAALDEQVLFVLKAVDDTVKAYGLELNMQKGKTELVCQYRGAKSTACRHHRFVECAGQLPLPNGRSLRVVAQYQHLGTAFHQGLSLREEIHGRLGKASAAYRQLSRLIFGNRKLKAATRLKLLESLVLSILFHGAGAWPLLNSRLYNKLSHAIVGWQRRIVNEGFWSATRLSDADLQAKWRLVPLSTRLAKHRLLYGFQMIAHAPQDLVTCLSAEDELGRSSSWSSAVRHALSWLHLHDPSVVDMAALQSTPELFQWLHQHRNSGPKMVRRLVLRATQQDFLAYETKSKIAELYRICGSNGVQFDHVDIPATPLQGNRATFSCHMCSSCFSTPQGLQAHQWRKHQLFSEERRYIYDATCRACNRCFWTTTSSAAFTLESSSFAWMFQCPSAIFLSTDIANDLSPARLCGWSTSASGQCCLWASPRCDAYSMGKSASRAAPALECTMASVWISHRSFASHRVCSVSIPPRRDSGMDTVS